MTDQLNQLRLDQLVNGLYEQGYWVGEDLLDTTALQKLVSYADQLAEEQFKLAGIGRATGFQVAPTQRSDRIHWLTEGQPEEAWFLNAMDELRFNLNRHLYLGLTEYECHFARYAAGAFYEKHRDAFRSLANGMTSQRKISTVLYLNQNWEKGLGGELLIYDSENKLLESVQPIFGRFVIFLSEDFPHEVLPATRERKSIAGWMRTPVTR